MKVYKSKLKCLIMIFIIYIIVFLELQFWSFSSTFKYGLIFILAALLFPSILRTIKRLDVRLKIFVYLYIFLVILSGFINRNQHTITHTFYGAIVYSLIIIEIIGTIYYVKNRYGVDFILKIITVLHIYLITINDVLVLVTPQLFFTDISTYYLLGNKFGVAYRHAELLALLTILIKKRFGVKKLFRHCMLVLYIAFSFLIFSRIQGGSGGSGTGIVAMIVLLIFFALPENITKNGVAFLISSIGATSFVFVFDVILSFGPVQYFIVNVLNKDLTLTGRVVIYEYVPKILSKHLLMGYGHGSSYETWMKFTHIYPNSQNGFIDSIVEDGFLATFILLCLAAFTVKHYSTYGHRNINTYPVLAVVYMYAILSCIEVTITVVFVWWILLLFFCTGEKDALK